MMHAKNIETLRDEAQRLLQLEITLLEKMKSEPGVIGETFADGQQAFDRKAVDKKIEVLNGELAKLENLEMVLAVVGTMKAGKSSTINAIVGTEVLPNRNRPMTALPTLIRHTPGQTEPLLKFDNSQPINELLITLHNVINSPKGKKLLKNLERNSDMDELLSLIGKEEKFKQRHQGADDIFWFLKSLNDLVRLSSVLKVEFPFSSYDEVHEMPVIEVEFVHLREMDQTSGRLTLLDTPGPNENGQQHLRSMLTEQLRKASAVLAVLDFTQLKSDADAAVRKELGEISEVTEGRLYTLVNKFDQKDRNGDSEEQVKAFVSETLMEGKIKKEVVFPVSSRWGYLANRAKHELFLHKKLPDYKKHPWVIDFAEEAFGRRWEKKIDDIEEVKDSAEKLWEDSLFSQPMENVIRVAHARAAAFAIDSAAAKLVDNAEKIENFLGIRKNALNTSVQHLQQQISALLSDIDHIEKSKKKAQDQSEKALSNTNSATKKFFETVKKETHITIDKYFKEGKRIERNKAREDSDRRASKSKKNNLPATQRSSSLPLVDGLLSSLLGDFDNRKQKTKESPHQDFDPNSPIITFREKKDANDLLKNIKNTIEEEMKHAESEMQKAMKATINGFRKDFANLVSNDAQKIVDEMKTRLKEDGFSINLAIPEVKSLPLKFSAEKLLENAISEKTENYTRYRRQSGVWGSICSLFDTDDWGWEEYQDERQVFEIDINDIRSKIIIGLNKTFDGLENSVTQQIKKPLQNSVSDFFAEFKSAVEEVRSTLNQSIDDQNRDKYEQEALATRLAELQKMVPVMLSDCRELKKDIVQMPRDDQQVPA